MTDHGGDEVSMDKRLLELTSNPDRFRTMVMLNDRTATVSEIAEALGLSVEAAARHVRALHDSGLIEVVGEVLRRGAVEPRYSAAVPTLWSDEEWAAINLKERQRLTAWFVDWIHEELKKAIDLGSFTARPDSHFSRTVSMVDEQGWRELCRIQEKALEASFSVQAASAERLAERREEGIPALSVMVCCELPARAPRD